MITVKKLVPYEKSYETQLFDQAVMAFIAAEISHSGIHEGCPEDGLVEAARILAKEMMDARNG